MGSHLNSYLIYDQIFKNIFWILGTDHLTYSNSRSWNLIHFLDLRRSIDSEPLNEEEAGVPKARILKYFNKYLT